MTLVLLALVSLMAGACVVPPPPPPTGFQPRTPCTPPAVIGNYPAGLTCRNVNVDGYTREFLVYVPAAVASAGTAVPMVVMYHGSSGTGPQFANISGWREKADAEGFIAVFPTGLEYFVTEDGKNRWNTKWNSFGLPEDIDLNKRLPGYPASSPWPADDVKFTSMMIDDVAAHHTLDGKRVYASGFSNGAAFGARLANDLPDRIAAVGTSGAAAAVHPPSLGTPPSGWVPAPIWQALGTQDDRAIEAFGVNPLPLDEPGIMATPKLSDVLRYNGAVYSGSTTSCNVSTTPHTTTIKWCAPGRPDYVFSMVEGMAHVYPNGHNNPYGVVAANVFWAFFQQHPHA